MHLHRGFETISIGGIWSGIVLPCALVLQCLVQTDAYAQRRPVLDQIDVPHDYYFREMYLPQLTSGPSSVAWLPDGGALVYSMQGALWRQAVGSGVAVQLTDGPGYDFQPDVSPDGTRVVFSRYRSDAVELALLDLESGVVQTLTANRAVNVEPRFSPDGERIAFVSTRDTGRFHVFIGAFDGEAFVAQALFEERESPIPRFYYSRFDHELSPVWAPDGKALLYISNRDVPYGTGSLWLASLAAPGKPKLVRLEETTWKARPDLAPDGRRIAYASYLGRQWHQLWVSHVDGVAEPLPLTYGAYDITAPRWSPDGRRIAFIANEHGNTELRVLEFVGGRTAMLAVAERRYLTPRLNFDLRVIDANGEPAAARVSVVAADGRAYAPANALVHADDGYDRTRAGFETKYFHIDGFARLALPAGAYRITIWRGPEHHIEQRLVNVAADRDNWLSVAMRPLAMPSDWVNWSSGDVHVHMNYGGAYRMRPAGLVRQARAEDLDVVFNLVVNKEQRIPDIAYFSVEPDAASDADVLLTHAQEYHTSFWGHLGLLGLDSHLLLPDYAAYPYTAAASVFPDNATIAKLARAQNAAVGYVHPFLSPPPDPTAEGALTNALPVDAALNLVDYYEVVGFADHRASADVWYRLLNCGARIAAAGGTDAMTNYASLRGPVGLNRTYVRVAGQSQTPASRRDAWLRSLRSGASMATNGPLVGLTVDGRHPGDEVRLPARERLTYRGHLRSQVPVDHLELVLNGEVVETFDLERDPMRADFEGRLRIVDSGWLLLRAWSESAHPLVFDGYPYATTSPVWIAVEGRPQHSQADADYFLAWLAKLDAAAREHPDYNDAAERDAVLAHIRSARPFYESCAADRD